MTTDNRSMSEPRSDGSGTVCRHCKNEIMFDNPLGWITCKSRDILCFTESSRNPRQGGHEPAPAEQPRKLADMEDYCDDCPDNGKCLELGTCRATIPAPVATSPAEGLQPKGDEFYLARKIRECTDSLERYVGIIRAQYERAVRDSTAQPSAKVDDIARELVKRLNLEDEEEQQIAAILRPYFPVDNSNKKSL